MSVYHPFNSNVPFRDSLCVFAIEASARGTPERSVYQAAYILYEGEQILKTKTFRGSRSGVGRLLYEDWKCEQKQRWRKPITLVHNKPCLTYSLFLSVLEKKEYQEQKDGPRFVDLGTLIRFVTPFSKKEKNTITSRIRQRFPDQKLLQTCYLSCLGFMRIMKKSGKILNDSFTFRARSLYPFNKNVTILSLDAEVPSLYDPRPYMVALIVQSLYSEKPEDELCWHCDMPTDGVHPEAIRFHETQVTCPPQSSRCQSVQEVKGKAIQHIQSIFEQRKPLLVVMKCPYPVEYLFLLGINKVFTVVDAATLQMITSPVEFEGKPHNPLDDARNAIHILQRKLREYSSSVESSRG